MAVDVESTNNDGVRFQSAIALGSAAAATLLACNLLTGVGDLDTAECLSDCEAGVPERTTFPDATLPGDDAAITSDASPPADGGNDAAKRPLFCNGIELYLPFDGTLDARSGQPPDLPPTVAFVPGKFGQGADLTGNSATAIYYASTYLGRTTYALTGGTIAMWVKPLWQPPCGVTTPSVLFKPRSARLATPPSAGPVMECTSTLTGLMVNAPDGGATNVGYPSGVVPNWNSGGWNHLVGTWSSAPTLQFAVNGATPVSTTAPWEPNESPVNFLRVGSESSLPRSVFDEIVLWSRVLSAMEIADLAASPVSVADACGL